MKILGTVFSFLGVAFLCAGLWWGASTRSFLARAATVDGVVVDLDGSRSSSTGTTYAPVVEFTPANGAAARFTSSMSSNPPAYQVGEHVTVYYDPAQPRQARLGGFFSLWLLPLLFSGLGLVFALIGGGAMLAWRWMHRRDADLRARGRPLQADFKTVEINKLLRINQRHPYRIVAQGYDPVSLKTREFRSRNLLSDPSPYLTAGGKLIVFVDPQRPTRYLLDTSFLPGSGG